MPANPNCKACPLHETASKVCVWGIGPTNASIFIIDEAPQERLGSDHKLSDALRDAGIPRSSVYISSIVRCRTPGNRQPKATEADACIKYLIEEIQDVQPKAILTLGGMALKTITGTDKIAAARGHALATRRGLYLDVPVYATYSPAASVHAQSDAPYRALVDDLKSLIVSGGPTKEVFDIGTKYLFPPGSDDASILFALKGFRDVETLAVDLEWTAGTKDRGNKADMIWPWSNRGEVFSISLTSEVLPFDDDPTSVALAWPPSPKVRKALKWLLSTKKCVYHNVMSDGLWLTAEGFEDYHVEWDTQLVAYLMDETQSLSLISVASKYAPHAVQTEGWKGRIRTTRPRQPAEWDDLLLYNARDTHGTLMAMDGIRAELAKLPQQRRNQILRLNRHLLLPAMRVLQKATLRGIPVDEQQIEKELGLANARQMKAAEDLAELTSTTPREAIKLANSGPQVKEFMKGAYGLELDDAQKDHLAEVMKDYPVIEPILRVRKETKIIGTYLDPWLTMLRRQGDGHLHSIYNISKVRTGRTSTESEEGGAVQVTPREAWARRTVRAKDGRLLVMADYSTVEMRIAAVIAKDQTMLSFFREGIDVHAATGAYIVACGEVGRIMSLAEYWPIRERWMAPILKEYAETGKSKPRQESKGVNFGLVFNMAPPKLQTYMKTKFNVDKTLAEVEEIHKGYFQLYTGIKPWQRQMLNDAERLGYSETMFGRRRKIEHQDLNAAVNNPVQSAASDFNLLAMIAADAAFTEERLDAYIIGVIHDSIMVDASEADAARAEQLLLWHMQNVDTSRFGFTFPIDLPAESKVSKSWAA